MKINEQNQRYKNVLPPQEKHVPSAKNNLKAKLKRPFKGAADWQCSHYYFWWEYLRRHEGYRLCCERGGKGAFSKLYVDFGDVHAFEFTDWWENKKTLFVAEPMSVFSTLSFIKEFIDFRHNLSYIKINMPIEPKYGVENIVPLYSLWEHLKVWDAKIQNPKLHEAELADIAGILVSDRVDGETVAKLKAANLPYYDVERTIRRRKQLTIQRHLRIAEQYIYNVGRGRFPLRGSR